MIDLFSTGRPAGDLLSRTVRVHFGGAEYELPVLTIAGNRRWKAQLDGSVTGLLSALETSGDDYHAILAAIGSQTDALLELLYAYDSSHVLPERASLEEVAYEDELLAAVREVWRAANPLVVTTVQAMAEIPNKDSLTPSNGPRPRTAGSRKRSKPS